MRQIRLRKSFLASQFGQTQRLSKMHLEILQNSGEAFLLPYCHSSFLLFHDVIWDVLKQERKQHTDIRHACKAVGSLITMIS